MLYIPDHQITDVAIIGIDPGSETLGVCELRFRPQDLSITTIQAFTYHASKLHSNSQYHDTHGDRLSRIYSLYHALLHLFHTAQPICIACESPFINVRRPQAYGALVEVVSGAIHRAVSEYSTHHPLYMVDPPSVKRAVGAKGNADKLEVQYAMSQIPEITIPLQRGLASLDEHSVDACAVAYHQLQQLRQGRLPASEQQPFSY